MAVPLLKTKLYIPPARPGLVARPRLIEQIDEGIGSGRKLTLLSAPAGFGKTTLLGDWIRQADRPVAWVSLDEGDNDPLRFWSYVTAALQTVQSDIGAAFPDMLQVSHAQPHAKTSAPQNRAEWIETWVAALVNELAECTDPLALVLDDLHTITDEENHHALLYLLHNLPPPVHLVLSTRADPPWPLARLRARGEMTELRAKELRFTHDEAGAFLNEAMKLGLSIEDVAALDARTEGWIAGLQMAALSMREHHDRSSLIQHLSGSQRFILDYLVEEVLSRQPKEVQGFLLRTSVLERLTAPLCDAVTGRDDSQALLARLEQANLFLSPLDGERRWYRYHHLFADLLRSRLEKGLPGQIADLHRRASGWYEQNGLITEAVNHLVAAGDPERVADLVEGNALAMLDRGELQACASWLDALPRDVMHARPWLGIAYAWVLAYTGQFHAIEGLLQETEKRLPRQTKPEEMRHITGHIATIRSYASALEGGISPTIELARRALAHLPDHDLRARAIAAAVLGGALKERGDLAAATQALTEAIAIGQAAGDSHVTITNLCDLVRLQMLSGALHDAQATCQRALHLANRYAQGSGWLLPVTGHVYTHLSRVLYEWNDIEAATRLAKEGVDLCRQWGWAELLVHGSISLAQALQAAGDAAGALEATGAARQAASGLSARFLGLVDTHEALLRLAQGDVGAASRWAQRCRVRADDELWFRERLWYLALARVLVAEGRSDEALALLARLLRLVEAAGAMRYVVQTLVAQAIAFQAQKKPEQALAALQRALSLAEPEGYVRTFVDHGESIALLLQQAAARGVQVDYVGTLLDALTGKAAARKAPTSMHPSSIEALTERELEVLRLLALGLSNKGIAETLVIAVGTVKQHLKHIYGKLDVHNRTEAASRARELDLV